MRFLHRVAVSSMSSLAAKREMHTARGSCDRSDIRYYGHPTRRIKFQENISSALRLDASLARPLRPLRVIIAACSSECLVKGETASRGDVNTVSLAEIASRDNSGVPGYP
jgi:hypothetical protein